MTNHQLHRNNNSFWRWQRFKLAHFVAHSLFPNSRRIRNWFLKVGRS